MYPQLPCSGVQAKYLPHIDDAFSYKDVRPSTGCRPPGRWGHVANRRDHEQRDYMKEAWLATLVHCEQAEHCVYRAADEGGAQ